MELQPIAGYTEILHHLKRSIRSAQDRATVSVNQELLSSYWEIGATILKQQQTEGWGTKVIDRLSQDLRSEFPLMKGLSPRNIKYMRAFAEAYPHFPLVQAPLALNNTESESSPISPSIVQVPLTHETNATQ